VVDGGGMFGEDHSFGRRPELTVSPKGDKVAPSVWPTIWKTGSPAGCSSRPSGMAVWIAGIDRRAG